MYSSEMKDAFQVSFLLFSHFDHFLLISSLFVGLLLFSKDDVVSNWNTNYALARRWRDQGSLSRAKCWESSPHVLHYKEYPEEYESEIDSFVSQLRITKAPKN